MAENSGGGAACALVDDLLELGAIGEMERRTADDIAEIAPGAADWLRVAAASLFISLRNGGTCLRLDGGLVGRLCGYIDRIADGGARAPAAVRKQASEGLKAAWGEIMRDGCAALATGSAPALFVAEDGTNGVECGGSPLVLSRRDGAPALFFQKYFVHETLLRGRIGRLASRQAAAPLPDALLARLGAHAGFRLGDDQVAAVRGALEGGFAIITGGPGTGKTTIVCDIIRGLLETGTRPADILLLAPTGRAAQRMSEAVAKEAGTLQGLPGDLRAAIAAMRGSTIHKALGYDWRTHGFKYSEAARLPAKVAVVDEVSMVEVVMMDKLLAALPDDCKVVLIGDSHQLPSVGAGAVLGDLSAGGVALGQRRLWTLTASHRNRGAVAQIAERVNAGDGGVADSIGRVARDLACRAGTGDGVFFVDGCDAADAESAAKAACEWARRRVAGRVGELAADPFPLAGLAEGAEGAPAAEARRIADELFAATEGAQVLAAMRRGPFGAEGLNRAIMQSVRGRRRFGDASAEAWYAGMPVMATVNNYDLGLFNGDCGVVVRGDDGRLHAIFKRGLEADPAGGAPLRRYASFPAAILQNCVPAYAITVHKSQGSEYGAVLLVLPPDKDNPLLSRELVYTGITRSRGAVYLIGSPGVLAAAVRNKAVRETGLAQTAFREP